MLGINTAEAFGCAVVVAFAYGVVRVLEYLSIHIAWWPL